MMNGILTKLFKISVTANSLFSEQTGAELEKINQHFSSAFSEAQLCGLVVTGMIARVFGLDAPKEPSGDGTRSLNRHFLGAFIRFLLTMDGSWRSGPNPLDDIVARGMRELDG